MSFKFWIIKHAGQYLCFINILFIMYPQIIGTMTIIEVNHLGLNPSSFIPLSLAAPKINGLPCSRNNVSCALLLFSVNISKAPSLKMLQFWYISRKEAPLCWFVLSNMACRCLGSRSMVRATKLASAPMASANGLNG